MRVRLLNQDIVARVLVIDNTLLPLMCQEFVSVSSALSLSSDSGGELRKKRVRRSKGGEGGKRGLRALSCERPRHFFDLVCYGFMFFE